MLPMCPNKCGKQTIQRVNGPWCPRCRGWYIPMSRNGEFMPYIRIHTYLP
jgi:Zn-finger nucleic acid-binding protein